MNGLPDPSNSPIGSIAHPSNGRVDTVTSIVIASDALAVELWDLGARVVGVFGPDRDGRVANVALRYAEPVDYTTPGHGYVGASVGRYANRIAGASAAIDDSVVALAPNEGHNQLHGGPIGLDQHIWTITESTNSSVAFNVVSEDGDQGFPGTVDVTVRYALEGDVLTIETTARCDVDTIFATTNHTYWNLAGAGLDAGTTVADHQLEVPAARYVEIDDELIPTGRLLPTADTRFDFEALRTLGDAVSTGGIDHCFVDDDHAASARLYHPGSGRLLEVTSNQPGIQVYTGQHLAVPFAAMCLEPELLPDTPNRPEFGSAVLRAGENYRHLMACRLSVASDH